MTDKYAKPKTESEHFDKYVKIIRAPIPEPIPEPIPAPIPAPIPEPLK